MPLTVEVVYEDGVLKPVQPLPLREHAKVQVSIQMPPLDLLSAYGIMDWKGDTATLERIALDSESLSE